MAVETATDALYRALSSPEPDPKVPGSMLRSPKSGLKSKPKPHGLTFSSV